MLSVKNMVYLMATPILTALACWAIWLVIV